MPALSVTNTFVAATLIESAEANQNFQDIVTWANANAIQKDASVAFTAVPTGPATDPVSDNQFARKAYVDKQKAANRQKFITNSIGYTGTNNTDFVLAVTTDVLRLYKAYLHASWILTGSGTYVIQLTEDGNVIGEFDITDGSRDITDSTIYFEPTAAAHTYRVRVFDASPGATVTFLGAATAPRQFWIEDTGLR